MFNFFRKKEEKPEEPKVSINYFIDKDNTPMMDIILQDYTDDTIKALCKLLDVLSKDGCYLNTIQMIQEGFLADNQDEALVNVLVHIAQQKTSKISIQSEYGNDFIKPSDVVT